MSNDNTSKRDINLIRDLPYNTRIGISAIYSRDNHACNLYHVTTTLGTVSGFKVALTASTSGLGSMLGCMDIAR